MIIIQHRDKKQDSSDICRDPMNTLGSVSDMPNRSTISTFISA